MNSMRKCVAVLMAFALAAFALPAAAHGNDTINLTVVAGPGANQMTASIKHNDYGDYMKSLKMPFAFGSALQSLTVNSVSISNPSNPPAAMPVPAVSLTPGAKTGTISVASGLKLSSTQTLNLTFTVTPVSSAGCAAMTTNWTGAIGYDGTNFGGERYPLAATGNVLTPNFKPACASVTGSASAGGSVACSPSPVALGGSSNCAVAINPGYNFTGFTTNTNSCASTGTTTCTVSNVTADVTVGALFSQIPYSITGVASPVAGGGVTCTPSSVFIGGSSTCTAAANSGYVFAGFSSSTNTCAPSGTGQCTVSGVNASVTVTATFNVIVTGTVNQNPAGPPAAGTVSCTTVPYGQSSTCTVGAVTPKWTFVGFGNNCTPPSPGSTTCTTSGVQSPTNVTANFVANNLSIASSQTSAAKGAAFPVTVSLTGADATVTLTPTNCPGITGSLTASGTSAVPASFSLTFDAPSTTCSLKATAPNYNDSGSLPVTVFAVGSLACGPVNAPPTAPNAIVASAQGVTSINDPGFAEGVRGSNTAVNKDGVTPNTSPCEFVNWTFTNNVLGTSGPTVDANGNTIPANGVSFVWDQTFQPNAAYSYTVTWQAEWFGLASPNNRKTQFCTGSGPTACDTGNLVFAQACLNPALERASIPVGAPACVSAEVWGVVDPGKCAALTALAGQTTCVVFTTTITDIKDPPIIRN